MIVNTPSKIISALILSFTVALPSHAEVLWSTFSLSYLQGNNYEVGDNKRKIVTFEHAAGTSWGDSFLFFDHIRSNNDDIETYGEWSPRLKLTDLENDLLPAVYLAATVEMKTANNSDGFTNYLMGFGTDIKVPYFDFFKANFYYRNNELGDDNYQTTLSWGVPVGMFYYDGFADISTSNDNKSASTNFTSQLKYDLAPHFNLSSKLYVGIEYVYWINKFGIKGVDEKNANLLVKYHF